MAETYRVVCYPDHAEAYTHPSYRAVTREHAEREAAAFRELGLRAEAEKNEEPDDVS